MGNSNATKILSSSPEVAGPLLAQLTTTFPALKDIDINEIEEKTGLSMTEFLGLLATLPGAVQTGNYDAVKQFVAAHPDAMKKIMQCFSKSPMKDKMIKRLSTMKIGDQVSNLTKLMGGNLDVHALSNLLPKEAAKALPLLTQYSS